MTRLLALPRIDRRLLVLLAAIGALSLFPAQPAAAVAKDGDGEVRVAGVCSGGGASELRLKSRDDGIEVRFKLHYRRKGEAWRVVFVQERRIAWKGSVKTTRSNGSFELRRTLGDLPGADAITASAWGPRGLTCRATATLSES